MYALNICIFVLLAFMIVATGFENVEVLNCAKFYEIKW
jgi:hypothetical protein